MKKNLVVILLIVLIAVVSGLGIFLYNKEHKVTETKKEVKQLVQDSVGIDSFKKKLEEAGFEIQEETECTDCNLMGAKEGKSLKINDLSIEVYKYDSENSDELTVGNLKMAQEEGKIKINDIRIEVLYNKGLVLTNIWDHPDKEKIVEVFNNL